jgi:hypothetical protein
MSEIVERVARAIYLVPVGGREDPYAQRWDELREKHQDAFRAIARAAIEAMREPTEAMMAGVDCAGEKAEWLSGKAWKVGWQAMIDEALK